MSREAGDTGTSIERQREAIEAWAAMHDGTVVGWAVDSGVSGSVDPFDTPELGPWLTQPRLPEWDALVAYRLDRLSRRVIPLNRLFGFVLEHGKTLASVNESVDLSTWIGRLVANVIAGVAEGELEAISERNRGSQRSVRLLGRWHGGTPPYGYTTEKRPDGVYLVHDPAEVSVIRDRIMPAILAHRSAGSVADDLNEAGIPTRKNGSWYGQTVRLILANRALLGQGTHNGRLVTDDDGMPVQRGEPIVTGEEFERLQAALDKRSVKRGKTQENPLAGVLFCYRCDEPMYLQSMAGRGYDYYRCRYRAKCGSLLVRTDTAVELVEQTFLESVGHLERRERVYIQGSDHQEALAAVVAAVAAARREKDLGLYEGDEDSYLERVQALTARKRELESLPAQPAGFQYQGTGETYAQTWERMTSSERHRMLLDSRIRLAVSAGPGRVMHSRIYVPDEMREWMEATGRTPEPSLTGHP